MPVKKCNNCHERYPYEEFNTDFVHVCVNKSNAVIQEDIKQIGTWTDYTGSSTLSETHIEVAGLANKLWGTDAAIDGDKALDVTPRGNPKQIYRSRQRLEYNDNSSE